MSDHSLPSSTENMAPSGEALKIKWQLVLHYLTPIQRYIGLDGVSEIMVNRFDTVFIERYGKLERVDAKWDSEFHLNTTIEQIANALGQAVHPDDSPLLDARLQDGSRINAALAPIGVKGSNMTIRLFPLVRLKAEDLLKTGSYNQDMLDFMRLAILCEYNIIISGGTGSGKTTLLNVLSNFIPDEDRIVSIEDTHELQINKPHWVPLEGAKRQIVGSEPITMARLVINALRMKPQRLIIGEIRDGAAAVAHMTAANTGHSGIVATIHSNNAEDTIDRITNLVSMGSQGIPYEQIQRQVKSNIHLIIHAEQTPRHGRRVTEIAEIVDGEVRMMWHWNYKEATHERLFQGQSRVYDLAEKFGIAL